METLKMERQMDSWNDGRLDELSGRMDEGFANVDKRFASIDKRFASIDKRFASIDKRFAGIDKRFVDIDNRFERVETEMRQGFKDVATKEEMAEVKGEFRYLNQRFDRLLHALMVVSLGFGATLFAALAGFVVTQA
jgi:archaellum component FlaC